MERPTFRRFDAYAFAAIFGISIIVASLLLYAVASKGSGSTATTASSATTSLAAYPMSATVTIPHADRFEPFVVEVNAGATVTWRNQDTDAHTVVAMPTDPVDFRLTVRSGESASFSFAQAGVYGYYCDIHSAYDSATGLVKADKGTDAYPISMYGIILVVDSSLAVAGGHDKVVVPGADRFQPLATVVHARTTVGWTNTDTDPHSIFSPPGTTQVLNLVARPGKTSDFAFQTPGVYTYYCNIHAQWNGDLHRVQALSGSSEYPAAMEGVVFVVP
jgi:plastocyanin